MQKLHLVGFTTDHRALILSARRGARSGGFLLEIDEAIAAAVSEAVERAAAEAADQPEEVSPEPAPRPQSALTVRELQARLRAGRSIEQVAVDAGVEPSWVARFAAPVLAEQARVVAAAREATLSRARLGESTAPLGAAVRRNLADRGLVLTADELDGAWSSYQIEDGRWVVTLRYTLRGRSHRPSWEFDLRTAELAARDRLAGALGFMSGEPSPAAPSRRTRGEPRARPAKAKAKAAAVPAREATGSSVGRRAAAARKTAAAQLDEAARRASRHNAEVARRGRRPAPTPAAAPEPDAAAAAAAPTPAAKAAPSPAAKPKAKANAKANAKAQRSAPAKKAPAKKAPAKRSPANTANAAASAPSAPGPPSPGPAAAPAPPRPTAAASPPSPAPGDSIAAALAAVRRELEEELQAFEQRRGGGPVVDPAPTPTVATPVTPARPDEGSVPPGRREPKVVRTPIDLEELGARGVPVFRGDVAPAGAATGNGSTAHAAPEQPDDRSDEPAAPSGSTGPDRPTPPARPARPPRTRPLRAR